jgi:hypothetical protein
LSLRKVHVLLAGLSRDCALSRVLDPDGHAWTVTDYLLASLLDAAHIGIWQRSGNAKAPKPPAVHRPGAKNAEKAKVAARSKWARESLARQAERLKRGEEVR